MAGTITAFAVLGVDAWHEGVLPDALRELSVRLDLAGAGTLLDQIMAMEWTDREDKRDPKPVPTPKPPAPPKPPTGPKGMT